MEKSPLWSNLAEIPWKNYLPAFTRSAEHQAVFERATRVSTLAAPNDMSNRFIALFLARTDVEFLGREAEIAAILPGEACKALGSPGGLATRI
jgi:hypothetical protein